MSVLIESPYTTSYFNTNWHLRFKVIADYCLNFGHFPFSNHTLGVQGQRTLFILGYWKARNGLPIRVNWIVFVRCYGWGAMSEYWLEIDVFEGSWSVTAKFLSTMGHLPLNHFCTGRIGQWMPYKSVADSIHIKKLCSRLSSIEVQFWTGKERRERRERRIGGDRRPCPHQPLFLSEN